MSSLSRRTATAGLLTLALLGVPSAALAAAGPDSARPAQAERGSSQASQAGSSDAARGAKAPAATPSAAAERTSAGSAGGAAAGRSAARPQQAGANTARSDKARAEKARSDKARSDKARSDKARSDKARSDKARSDKARSDKARADKARADKARADKARPATAAPGAPTRTADPRGNNGTFKVDGPVLDTGHGNEPHVSCEFRLNFFGYDAGQLADISFTAVAPTRGATTKVDGLQLISSSTAKGGQYDGSYPVTGTWDAGDLGLDPTQRHHIKVSVESVNADGSDVPGGAKHKVFWLEPCGSSVVAATAAAPVHAPVFGPRAVVPTALAPAAVAPVPAAPQAAAPEAAVLAGSVSARSAAPATVVAAPAGLVQPFVLPPVSARASASPETLPFTGSPQLLALLLSGVVTLAGGTALLIAVRRTA